MFYGNHEYALDDKGRTSLPAVFRKLIAELGDSDVVVTIAPGGHCLWAYTRSAWDKLRAAIEKKGETEDVTDLEEALFPQASDVPFDKVGRILLPPRLREVVPGPEVVWVGMNRRMELWNKKDFDTRESHRLANPLPKERLRGLPT